MKHYLEALLRETIDRLAAEDKLGIPQAFLVPVERSRDSTHGDFASPVAMLLARPLGLKPRHLAERILSRLPPSDKVEKAEVAGPGFINFFLSPGAFHSLVDEILAAQDSYGCSSMGAGDHVHLEFVSANPTGPLHVGHGRGAAYGAALANLLSAAGFDVHREYYVNDAGRQMDILATSIWLRYLELCGEQIAFPDNGYQGDYVWDIAARLHRERGTAYQEHLVMDDLPTGEFAGGDKEAHLDALIDRARRLLGEQRYLEVHTLGLQTLLDDIRDDLEKFGVHFDTWYSERSLLESGILEQTLQRLQEGGHLYAKEGALWFRSTDFGDEKDRVVIRENGQKTYFASDIAYHLHKLEQGFTRLIDVWGADHHGYVQRVKGALQALGADPHRLQVLLVQFAILYRSGQRVPMSTRSGEFVTLRQLRKEVGNDAARFFYVLRKSDQHLDFDLDLARSQSKDNPVYYVQYAHARICSVMRELGDRGYRWDEAEGSRSLHLLTEPHESALLRTLARYPEVLESAAQDCEPHQIAFFLRELANDFHTYYNAHTFLVEEKPLRNARLSLIAATRQVIRNGLTLLGVSAPEAM